MNLSESFVQHFSTLEDPRKTTHNKKHNFMDILVITILGTICGSDNWSEICAFGKAKESWLKTFLDLPNGIPSHDTFSRVFSLIKTDTLDECYKSWIKSLNLDLKGNFISIDGKTLRGSANKRKNKKPIHLVSAWSSELQVMLGQIQTEEKSNEITAIPEVLNIIDVEGATVTIDAMGCQSEIAKKISDEKGDYIFGLKGNQPKLLAFVEALFDLGTTIQYKKILHRRKKEKVRKRHGRTETRTYTLISARDNIPLELRFPGMRGFGKLEVVRTENNKVERSTRYFITSLQYEDIDQFMKGVRSHWDIEINLHWSLDVSFREDLNQVRNKLSAKNLATVRRIALNLLKNEKTAKIGISGKRKKAGWDNQYLLQVLSSL